MDTDLIAKEGDRLRELLIYSGETVMNGGKRSRQHYNQEEETRRKSQMIQAINLPPAIDCYQPKLMERSHTISNNTISSTSRSSSPFASMLSSREHSKSEEVSESLWLLSSESEENNRDTNSEHKREDSIIHIPTKDCCSNNIEDSNSTCREKPGSAVVDQISSLLSSAPPAAEAEKIFANNNDNKPNNNMEGLFSSSIRENITECSIETRIQDSGSRCTDSPNNKNKNINNNNFFFTTTRTPTTTPTDDDDDGVVFHQSRSINNKKDKHDDVVYNKKKSTNNNRVVTSDMTSDLLNTTGLPSHHLSRQADGDELSTVRISSSRRKGYLLTHYQEAHAQLFNKICESRRLFHSEEFAKIQPPRVLATSTTSFGGQPTVVQKSEDSQVPSHKPIINQSKTHPYVDSTLDDEDDDIKVMDGSGKEAIQSRSGSSSSDELGLLHASLTQQVAYLKRVELLMKQSALLIQDMDFALALIELQGYY